MIPINPIIIPKMKNNGSLGPITFMDKLIPVPKTKDEHIPKV